MDREAITRFTEQERRKLLVQPGIGPKVVERIEAIGVTSIEEMGRLGVDQVVQRVCDSFGTIAWSNRRLALRNALLAIKA